MVTALILLFEWIVPWMADRPMDWAQFVFACIFGLQIIILHTALAYVRPPTEAETIVMVEHAMQEAEERRRLAPGITIPRTPQMQMAKWAANDPRWEKLTETTEIEVPVMRPKRL